jgi:hypothetical protein
MTRFVGDMTREELLRGLAALRDDRGLDHVANVDGSSIGPAEALDDQTLRELLKLARWRRLLWSQQDE